MISKRRWLISLILVFFIAWCLGYLSLPYLPDTNQFWLGALSVLATLILYISLKGQVFRIKRRTYILFSLLLLILSSSIFYFHGMLRAKQKANFEASKLMIEQLKHEVEMIYAQERIYQRRMVDKAIASLDGLNKDQQLNTLSALSKKLKPIDKFYNDSMISLSPGRGHLLKSILELDSSISRSLLSNIDFSNADLQQAELRNIDLSSTKLGSAFLYQADIRSSNLMHANLESAILIESKLDSAVLDHAMLNNADFRWCNLNYASLRSADALGSDFSHSGLRDAYLDSSRFKWARLKNVMLIGSTMKYTDLLSAHLHNSDLSSCNLSNARLSRAILKNTNLSNTNLDGISIYDDWFSSLKKFKTIGIEMIQADYIIKEEGSELFSIETHALRRK